MKCRAICGLLCSECFITCAPESQGRLATSAPSCWSSADSVTMGAAARSMRVDYVVNRTPTNFHYHHEYKTISSTWGSGREANPVYNFEAAFGE